MTSGSKKIYLALATCVLFLILLEGGARLYLHIRGYELGDVIYQPLMRAYEFIGLAFKPNSRGEVYGEKSIRIFFICP